MTVGKAGNDTSSPGFPIKSGMTGYTHCHSHLPLSLPLPLCHSRESWNPVRTPNGFRNVPRFPIKSGMTVGKVGNDGVYPLSFPPPLCHSRPLFVIPAPSLSFPRKRESTLKPLQTYIQALKYLHLVDTNHTR